MVKDILRITARHYPFGYQQIYASLYKETVYGKKLTKNSLSVTLNRMKNKGLLIVKDKKFTSTQEGRFYAEKSEATIKSFSNLLDSSSKDKPKKLIVIFDIPEKIKLYRDWLRSELVGFGFTMIQKSVWFGPALPKEFIEYLDEVRLLRHVRFFQATEKDLI